MRIISGIFKGKKINEPEDLKTRPLKDLTKESIFNLINHSNKFKINLKNAKVLDLFSGVGSFGIECLSRGANEVIFIENYKNVLRILKKNLFSLKSIHNYQIIENNIYDLNTLSYFDISFDIIFIDPPYKDKNLSLLLEVILKKKILKKKGIIILHRHKTEQETFPKEFRVLEEKIYGISKIIFISCAD